MTRVPLMLALVALALGSGCSTYSTAVVSQQGKAYVIVSGMFGQTMYNCDASSGKPICTELKEEK